ncbi:hypothetical protein DVDV_0108 [Desulfovibrio sp. DV]|uniref:hypothetical protein n=1 Tax=Desulfovibrio sp. DV TaxID=1844708 RepID=UPI00094BB289|nr:hypothetical protein [Desulfovibrio sp. DV]OLN31320.1 hypothetical protein DVDV_0108 [Desulfovibrio sp. DV]
MINRALTVASGLILVVLLAALGWQTVQLARSETRIAVLARELGEANTRVSLLEADQQTLTAGRDALAGQVEACQQTIARVQARAADRVTIIRNVKVVPRSAAGAGTGGVVDDATCRRAIEHLNGCR